MLANILDYVLLNKLNKATRSKLIEGAFFTFNGLLVGVLINDIFKLLGGNINTTPTGIRLFNHELMKDELYGYMISIGAGVTAILPNLQIYHKWTNNVAFSLGMNFGIYYANTSEARKYVGLAQEAG